MKLKANYHTHTVFCDGADTPEDVVLAAIGKGFTHLGFSGHMDYFAHVDAPRYFAELRRLEEKYAGRIEILHGLELDRSIRTPRRPRRNTPSAPRIILMFRLWTGSIFPWTARPKI